MTLRWTVLLLGAAAAAATACVLQGADAATLLGAGASGGLLAGISTTAGGFLRRRFAPRAPRPTAGETCSSPLAPANAHAPFPATVRREPAAPAALDRAADTLTGLPNRAQGLARIDLCVQRRQRDAGGHFAVLVVDLDRFALVNTTIGHDAADGVLVEVAARLRAGLRMDDTVDPAALAAKLDGGRFMILLEDLRRTPDAARVAQRILDRFAEPFHAGGQEFFLSCSIGIATSDRDYSCAEDLLRDADAARARASAAGGGLYVLFDGTAPPALKSRLALESALRAAVRDEAIQVHYQPVVRIADGGLVGFEALARWNDPEFGRVPPVDMIAIAEDTSIIHALGALVFRTACRQQRQWRDSVGEAAGMVSVNLSAKQLAHPGLLRRLTEIMQETRVRPEWMSLEITESALLLEPDLAAATLARLRDIGMSLQLDDFGTGYSSLSRLHRLPLDALKVDRSFVQDICTRREHVQVLEAVTSIARAFGMKVTVEGVETADQLAIVRRLHIDCAQGYLFGKPMPAAEASRLLRRTNAAPAVR